MSNTPIAQITFPAWLEKLPAKKKTHARNRFLLRIAAIHYSASGSISALSKGIGCHPNSLHEICRKPLSPETCVKIEKLVGRNIMPREFLNPSMFQLPV